MSATAAAAEAKADRLARELEEAEEEISAMSSKMRQQVSCLKDFSVWTLRCMRQSAADLHLHISMQTVELFTFAVRAVIAIHKHLCCLVGCLLLKHCFCSCDTSAHVLCRRR